MNLLPKLYFLYCSCGITSTRHHVLLQLELRRRWASTIYANDLRLCNLSLPYVEQRVRQISREAIQDNFVKDCDTQLAKKEGPVTMVDESVLQLRCAVLRAVGSCQP